jgi:hypothetical protein
MITAAHTYLGHDSDGEWDYPVYEDIRPHVHHVDCDTDHRSAWGARRCHEGAEMGACDDLVSFVTEDGVTAIECGHERAMTDTGWTCAAGHGYVPTDVREAQGWDYADDAYDAAVIIVGGRDAVPYGSADIDPGEVVQIMTTL